MDKIEILSEYIHSLWIEWASSIVKSEIISEERKKRWSKCFVHYNDLTEEEKDKDRKIAKEIIDVLEKEYESGNVLISNRVV